MARAGFREIVFGLATAGLLAGCVDGKGSGAGGDAGAGGDGGGFAVAPAAKRASGTVDVEAPEVFQATDSALWDGRPSLGGIWVAAPEVTNPERAVMFNPATGKSVTGALFKRERDNPGPRLQLSSDAAEALGILAGQPTEIRVTALRKAEEKAPAEEVAAATPTADPAAGPAAGSGKDGEAAAIASAALAAVDADKSAEKPAGKPVDGAGAGGATTEAAAGVAAVAADGTAAVVDQTPKRKTWKERRAEAKAAREEKKRLAAEAAAAASAAQAEAAAAAPGAEPVATAESAAVAPIESAPLDARNPDAVAGTTAPAATTKPKRKTLGDGAAPAAEAPTAVTPAAEASPAVAPAASGGPERSIQVASFSKEENAKRAAEALARIGVTATPQKSEKDGKAVWGVIVRGDAAMLKKIKDAGFADAYFLK